MKSIVLPQPVKLSNETKENLPAEVKETVATEVTASKKKFTAIDMWNCNRQSRSANSRRRSFNLN